MKKLKRVFKDNTIYNQQLLNYSGDIHVQHLHDAILTDIEEGRFKTIPLVKEPIQLTTLEEFYDEVSKTSIGVINNLRVIDDVVYGDVVYLTDKTHTQKQLGVNGIKISILKKKEYRRIHGRNVTLLNLEDIAYAYVEDIKDKKGKLVFKETESLTKGEYSHYYSLFNELSHTDDEIVHIKPKNAEVRRCSKNYSNYSEPNLKADLDYIVYLINFFLPNVLRELKEVALPYPKDILDTIFYTERYGDIVEFLDDKAMLKYVTDRIEVKYVVE